LSLTKKFLKNSFLGRNKALKVKDDSASIIQIKLSKKIIEHNGKINYEFSVKLPNTQDYKVQKTYN
jgi:hypothetical protein